jgi:hypothetical protein
VEGETVKSFAGIVIFLISLFAMAVAHSCKSEVRTKHPVLALDYVGEQDVPTTPIVISDSELGTDWYRGAFPHKVQFERPYFHVVPSSLFENLIAEVELHKGVPEAEIPRDRRVLESISATIFAPQGTNVFYYNKESAVLLLDGLLKRCENEAALRSDLEYFQHQIRTGGVDHSNGAD